MAKAVGDSAEAQTFVRETQHLARLLHAELQADLEQATQKPTNILPLPEKRSFWSDARWMSIGVAALLAVCAVVAAVALSSRRGDPMAPAGSQALVQLPAEPRVPPADVQMEVLGEPERSELNTNPAQLLAKNEHEPEFMEEEADALVAPAPPVAGLPSSPVGAKPASAIASLTGGRVATKRQVTANETPAAERRDFNTAGYDYFEENPFLAAGSNPLSTFSIDVDTASYANVRRFLNSGTLPPKDAVRIEEMVNYFSYDYPKPEGSEPFSINLDVAGCPWQPEHRLVRIGLRGREVAADQRGPSNLVFLLDVSGSMEPADRLPLIKQSMRMLVDNLTENDRVAIVVYAGASGLALPSMRGDQKERINKALEELAAGGATNGAEGITLAYRIAMENFIKGGVNRVILATDGDFNVGVTSQGDLVRLAQEKAKGGVFLTVLGVGGDNLQDSTMQKLADKANGNYAHLDSLAEARKVLVEQVNGTLVTIARDVKIQVEFNPTRVASYRLLGYEKRVLRKEDFNNDKVDAGEIGAGHTVTALYEVIPVGAGSDPAANVPAVDPLKYQAPATAAAASSSAQMLTVKLRHKEPAGDESKLAERTLMDEGASFAQASADFRFVAAVAEFGMILRASPHKGSGTFSAVLDWALEAKGSDATGYRAGFVELVRKAQGLGNG